MSGSDISWAMCKSAPWPRHTTSNHTSISPLSFHRPDAFPAAQPTASRHWQSSFVNHLVISKALHLRHFWLIKLSRQRLKWCVNLGIKFCWPVTNIICEVYSCSSHILWFGNACSCESLVLTCCEFVTLKTLSKAQISVINCDAEGIKTKIVLKIQLILTNLLSRVKTCILVSGCWAVQV